MKNQLSEKVSENVLTAINGALEEEKQSFFKRSIKAFVSSLLVAAFSLSPLFLIFSDKIDEGLMIASLWWWLFLLIGFSLYYYPQPRLVVSGYWSFWVLSKALIATSVFTCLILLICPSFVFVHSSVPWSPFEPLTLWLMSVGGMPFCMFVCGLLFSTLAGLLAFSMVSKTLNGSSLKNTFKIASLVYVAQLPILFIQVWDETLRAYVLFWLIGSFLGHLLVVFSLRSILDRART